MTVTDLSELIEMVQQATGWDRDLDRTIHEAVNPPLRPTLRYGIIPKYTSSLDAISALIEQKLPTALRRVQDAEDGVGAQADLILSDGRHIYAEAATWCLALTLAFLLALQSEQNND